MCLQALREGSNGDWAASDAAHCLGLARSARPDDGGRLGKPCGWFVLGGKGPPFSAAPVGWVGPGGQSRDKGAAGGSGTDGAVRIGPSCAAPSNRPVHYCASHRPPPRTLPTHECTFGAVQYLSATGDWGVCTAAKCAHVVYSSPASKSRCVPPLPTPVSYSILVCCVLFALCLCLFFLQLVEGRGVGAHTARCKQNLPAHYRSRSCRNHGTCGVNWETTALNS